MERSPPHEFHGECVTTLDSVPSLAYDLQLTCTWPHAARWPPTCTPAPDALADRLNTRPCFSQQAFQRITLCCSHLQDEEPISGRKQKAACTSVTCRPFRSTPMLQRDDNAIQAGQLTQIVSPDVLTCSASTAAMVQAPEGSKPARTCPFSGNTLPPVADQEQTVHDAGGA